jgi:hypothetical protein
MAVGLLDMPREILILIAERFIDTRKIKRHPRKLTVLTSICTTLRMIFVGAPQLWTTISSTHCEDWTTLALARSRTQPLSVSIRLKSDSAIWADMMGCLPRAENVQVDVEDYSRRLFDIGVLAANTHLRVLSLHHVSIDQEFMAAFPLLDHLSLYEIQMSAEGVQRLLHSAPSLKSIVIKYLHVTHNHNHKRETLAVPNPLPYLRNLAFKNTEPSIVAMFLGMISYPSEALQIAPMWCPTWSSATGPNQHILAYVEGFRAAIIKSPLSVMLVVDTGLSGTVPHIEISASTGPDRGSPSLRYLSAYLEIENQDPILDLVHAARIKVRHDVAPRSTGSRGTYRRRIARRRGTSINQTTD